MFGFCLLAAEILSAPMAQKANNRLGDYPAFFLTKIYKQVFCGYESAFL